jgi:hypothetical protein
MVLQRGGVKSNNLDTATIPLTYCEFGLYRRRKERSHFTFFLLRCGLIPPWEVLGVGGKLTDRDAKLHMRTTFQWAWGLGLIEACRRTAQTSQSLQVETEARQALHEKHINVTHHIAQSNEHSAYMSQERRCLGKLLRVNL